MATLLALVLAITAPTVASTSTDWMRLDAFHLTIGMSRAEAVDALRAWSPKRGKDDNELVVDYSSDKAITLEFKKERLTSVRFELFVLLPHARKAFAERRAVMGEPRKATRSILIYDNALPNAIVVVNDDPKSEQGKKGVGVVAVRYYDPR